MTTDEKLESARAWLRSTFDSDDIMTLLEEENRLRALVSELECQVNTLSLKNLDLMDTINGYRIELKDLEKLSDKFEGALEDITTADETSTMTGLVAVARHALEARLPAAP